MAAQTPTAAVRAFVDAVNAHNMGAMPALMTDDHRFVDALGAEVRGREEMRKAWVAYLLMVPDYTITVQDMVEHGDLVAVFGTASGTLAVGGASGEHLRWQIPAAWRAVVSGGRISEWRIYADNEPVRQLMSRGS